MDGEPPGIDLRGLRCPLPALKTARALRRAARGATVLVIADDPMARLDIPNLVRERGDALIAEERDGEVVRFLIRRAAAD